MLGKVGTFGIPSFVGTILPRIGKRSRTMLNISGLLSNTRYSEAVCPINFNLFLDRTFSTNRISTKSAATLERKSFWRDLYHNGNDVFTLPEANTNLVKYLPDILPTEYVTFFSHEGSSKLTTTPFTEDSFPKILVPGCGRDISMFWLAKQGIGVIGVDYIGEPLRIFGNDFGGLTPVMEDTMFTGYQIMQYPKIILIHGDILQLEVPKVYGGTLDGVWDRGSLTSIVTEDRQLYIQQLSKSLRSNGKLLLEYLCCNIPLDGALDQVTVQNLLEENGFAYKMVSRTNVRSLYPNFNPPGLAYLDEIVIIATKRD